MSPSEHVCTAGEWEQRQQQKRAGLLTVQAGGVKEGARSLLGGLPQTAPPPTGQPAPVGVLSGHCHTGRQTPLSSAVLNIEALMLFTSPWQVVSWGSC